MSEECKDFITLCLKKKPDERIGSKDGIDEILKHPWFGDIDVEKLLSKSLTPEFTPKVSKDMFDVSQFDKMFTSEEAVHSVLPQAAQRKIIKNQDKFAGFDK
jgi:serine/threonine protein kinase